MKSGKFFVLSTLFFNSALIYAAQPVNLMQHSLADLPSLSPQDSNITMKETSRDTDNQQTEHIRFQEMYQGYPVFGADSVLHVPNQETSSTALSANQKPYMNGIYYQDLNADLANTPPTVFTRENIENAIETTVKNHLQKINKINQVQEKKSELMVYVNEKNKARYAYQISFHIPDLNSRPVYLIDAETFTVYKQWNDIQTATTTEKGGGYGGNQKKYYIYDGLVNHLSAFSITRDSSRRSCLLQNSDVLVGNADDLSVIRYQCLRTDAEHNKIYWNGFQDYANGGYSPSNDSMYNGMIIKNMFQEWYKLPVLRAIGSRPIQLKMYVHDNGTPERASNASWDSVKKIMRFGDGDDQIFYPLTSLGITAHEVSHGFTNQHSNLIYEGQSGAMNESFSDMGSQAAEFYAYGESSWQLGAEVFRIDNVSLRYMDQPSKDCYGRGKPGDNCSIDNANQYKADMDVHFSSGVYNRFFNLLSKTDGWNTRKAFDLMVQANAHFWTKTTKFNSGGCFVLQAAAKLKMDIDAIKRAFDETGVDYTQVDTMTPPGRCIVNGKVVEKTHA